MIFKIAIVKWIDSTYYKYDGEFNLEEIREQAQPKLLYSIGSLLFEDDKFLVISQDFEESTKTARLGISIPKCSIIDYEIKKINVKKFDKKK